MIKKIKTNRYLATLLVIVLLLSSFSCKGKDDDVIKEPFFSIEGSTELLMPASGGSQDYSVKSNGKWEVIRKSIQTWAEAKPAYGENDGLFRITVAENRSNADRSLSFSFMLDGNELQDKISVTQEGGTNDDGDDDDDDGLPLYTLYKIWDLGRHNAFTDLIEFEESIFVIQEGGSHVPQKPEDDGKIRVLVSTDG